MGTHPTIVDASSPAQIARAIVKVNKTFGLHRAGMDVLWKLYYVANHTLTCAELEREFGLLEDHFGFVDAWQRSLVPMILMLLRL